MNKEINLLSGKRNNRFNEYRALRTARTIAVVFLVIVVVLSLVSFSLNRNSQITATEQQKKIVSSQLFVSQSKIITFLLLKARLHQIDQLFTSHNAFGKILSDIIISLPADVNVDACTINQKKLSVTLSSPSLLSLQLVIDSVTDKLHKKQFFKKITISSLTADPKIGKYILFIDADII